MIKKIKISKEFVYNYECLSDLVPTLEKYGFENFATHAEHTDFVFAKKSAWFYSDCYNIESYLGCGNCEYKLSKYFVKTHIDECDCFFDFRFNHRELQNACKIFWQDNKENRIFIGIYCKKNHILFASDWTHSEINIPIADSILCELSVHFAKPEIKPEIIDNPDKKIEEKVKVELGCDPEFEQLLGWNFYNVRRTNISTEYYEVGEIGVDGAGDQIELRPNPANTPEGLVENIRELFKKLRVPVSVKGDIFPLGGHIHFGIPKAYKNFKREMVEILDDFLGKPLIELSGEARGSYKRLGAYREQEYGFEYRTVPSAYLFDPEFAYITFKIAQNVVEKLLSEKEISYNKIPTEEDYIRIAEISKDEYQKFLNYINEYKKYNGKPINMNWVDINDFSFVVKFQDSWENETKILFREAFKDYEEMLKEKKIFEVVLYGLREDRGEVIAGFNCEGFETIEHPARKFVGCYGIPYRVRQRDTNEEEVRKIVASIVIVQSNKELIEDLILT